jgi:hypothetical protein
MSAVGFTAFGWASTGRTWLRKMGRIADKVQRYDGGLKSRREPGRTDAQPHPVARIPSGRSLLLDKMLTLVLLVLPFVGVGRSGFPFVQYRPNLRKLSIQRNKVALIGRDVIFGHDGLDGAFRLAQRAVYAFLGIDDQHVRAFVETVDRADFNAIGIFAFDTGFSDDESHFGVRY